MQDLRQDKQREAILFFFCRYCSILSQQMQFYRHQPSNTVEAEVNKETGKYDVNKTEDCQSI